MSSFCVYAAGPPGRCFLLLKQMVAAHLIITNGNLRCAEAGGPGGVMDAGADDDESADGSLSSSAPEAGGLGGYSLQPQARSSSPVTIKSE